MRNLLADGAAWLQEQRRAHASIEITYSRGTQSATIPAAVGSSRFEVTDANNNMIVVEMRDYVIGIDDLLLDGIPTEPQEGDRIKEGGFTCEVGPPSAGGKEWEWSTPFRTGYVVHTKPVAQES